MTTEQWGVDGGPAFPSPSFAVPRSLDAEHVVKLRDMQGMTLRDYFAAKAMQGIWADSAIVTEFGGAKQIAKAAYEQADAMLAARSQP